MKKILFITRQLSPPWDEASKNFAFNLAKNIGDSQITLLVNKFNDGLPSNIRQKKIYSSNKFNLAQKLRLLKFLRASAKNYDIIHFLFTPTKINSWIIKKIIQKNKTPKIIQTIATLRDDLYSDEQIKNLIFGNVIIAYSRYAKEKLDSLGISGIKQIYPGIDLTYYFPVSKNNLQPNNFTATYPGEYFRLGATDNITEMIVRHKNELKNNNIKIVFACRVKNAADKKKKKEVVEKLQSAGALELAIFTDTVSDMAALYNSSNIIIFPIRNMSGKFDIPLAVIEAMACKKPVIISNLPKLSEFTNGNISVKINAGDAEEMFAEIMNLYENKNKCDMVGKNAENFVKENFDIQKIAKKYQEIYNEL